MVTGFLGAGKTSLINLYLREPVAARTLVLVNEIGAAPIDHALVNAPGAAAISVMENGCLCCAYRDDLVARVAAALDDHDGELERLIIETSGLAHPAGVEKQLMSDPALAKRLRFCGIICCIAAPGAGALLSRFIEAQTQIALADRIALTKTDLGGDIPPLGATPTYPAPFDRAALSALFNDASLAAGPEIWIEQRTQAHSALTVLNLKPRYDRAELEAKLLSLCAEYGPRLLRVKAIVDDGGQSVAAHVVCGLLYPFVTLPRKHAPAMLVVAEPGLAADLRDRLC